MYIKDKKCMHNIATILPNDFIVNDDTSYYNLSVYDGTGSIT
jgi:hypothetical protein